MRDTIREIILANLDRDMLKRELESYVVDYMKATDMKAVIEYIIDDIDITEVIVEAVSEILLPF